MRWGERSIEVKSQLSIELSLPRRRSSSSADLTVMCCTGWKGWIWRGWSSESSSLWTELSDWPNTRQNSESLQEFF